MSACVSWRPVSWVLDNSCSVFVAVIRDRLKRGDAPVDDVAVYDFGDLRLAYVRYDEDRHCGIYLRVTP